MLFLECWVLKTGQVLVEDRIQSIYKDALGPIIGVSYLEVSFVINKDLTERIYNFFQQLFLFFLVVNNLS